MRTPRVLAAFATVMLGCSFASIHSHPYPKRANQDSCGPVEAAYGDTLGVPLALGGGVALFRRLDGKGVAAAGASLGLAVTLLISAIYGYSANAQCKASVSGE